MSYFVLTYNRRRGKLESIDQFAEVATAEDHLFRAEREHVGDENLEVVLLASPTQEQLLRTHGRYFKSMTDLLEVQR